jgi:cell division protein FtsB
MRVAFAFGICIMLLSLFAGERGFPAIWKAHREAQQIERDIAALKADNTALRERVQALREDGRTIELIARETLGLAHPGEMVVVRRR